MQDIFTGTQSVVSVHYLIFGKNHDIFCISEQKIMPCVWCVSVCTADTRTQSGPAKVVMRSSPLRRLISLIVLTVRIQVNENHDTEGGTTSTARSGSLLKIRST